MHYPCGRITYFNMIARVETKKPKPTALKEQSGIAKQSGRQTLYPRLSEYWQDVGGIDPSIDHNKAGFGARGDKYLVAPSKSTLLEPATMNTELGVFIVGI